MANAVPPTGNGYTEDRKAIALRLDGIELALDKQVSACDAKHKHHFSSEKEMRALVSKIKGMWMGIAVVAALLASLVSAWGTFAQSGGG